MLPRIWNSCVWARRIRPFLSTHRPLSSSFRRARIPPPQLMRRTLLSGVLIGPLYMSMGLVLDPHQDHPEKARLVAAQMVQDILDQPNAERRQEHFWAHGRAFLEIWSHGPATERGKFPMTSIPTWKKQTATRVLTAPDPDDPRNANFLLCQATLKDDSDGLNFAQVEDRQHALAEAMFPQFCKLAKEHGANRGALVVVESGGYSFIYWDGTRFVEVEFLEAKKGAYEFFKRDKAMKRGEI